MLRLLASAVPYVCLGAIVALAIAVRGQMPMHNAEQPRETVKTARGWDIAFQRGGDVGARRVIYVHGTPGSSGAFRHYVARPVHGTQSISIDRPGFGDTTPVEPVYSLEAQAAAIEPFLEASAGRPILVGHSLGAPIAVQAAIDHPDRVGGIVLVSSALDPELERIFWYQYLGESGIIPHLLPKAIVNSNRELMPLKRELEKLQTRLGEIACPVAIVHARDDSLCPFSNVAFMHEHFPEGAITDEYVLDVGDHFLPWNSELIVRSAIEALLDRAS